MRPKKHKACAVWVVEYKRGNPPEWVRSSREKEGGK